MDVPREMNSIWRAGGMAWVPVTTSTGRSAVFRCPSSHTGSLTHSHQIAADGTVTPSVICTSCGFHENLKLVGWAEQPPT